MALIYLMHQILEPPLTPPWKGENSDFPPSKGGTEGGKTCMVCQVCERLNNAIDRHFFTGIAHRKLPKITLQLNFDHCRKQAQSTNC